MILHNILRFGITKETPKYLGAKIYLSNALALIIGFGIAILFGIISLIYFPSIAFIPFGAFAACLIIIGANYLGFIRLSRVILSLSPFLLILLFGAYLTPKDHPPLAAVTALCLGFTTAPFILFDVREKWPLISCGALIMIITTFLIPTINGYFEKSFNIEIIETGTIFNVTMLMSVIVACGGTLFLSLMNHLSNQRTEKLVREMDVRNEELENSQQEMKNNLEKIEKNQIEEQRRNWSSEGLAKFGNLLRSNQESSVLFDQLISDITQYLKANQGGLFLVNVKDDDIEINLQSCYAYDRKKFLEKSIAPGQGLIGQSYYERDVIHLRDVPDNYLKITSGLGELSPKSVLVIPLMVNDEVEGFFEIASFKQFEDHEIEFLKNLGENVASFIGINRINEKTKYLLEETQQQAEEMKSQEEEMRQNMEELQATQEEMQRKEQEYIDRISELEKNQIQN